MDNAFEIIAAIVGMVLYWVMSSKDDKKKRPSKGPNSVNPPIAPRQASRPKAEAPAPPPPPKPKPKPAPTPKPEVLTFEELLEQFGKPKKPQQAGKNSVLTRAEREAKHGIDDEYIPATDTRRQAREEMKQYYSEQNVPNSLITRTDLKDKRDSFFKEEKPPEPSRYAKLLQNPKTLRDMLVAKEIFDTKYF